MIKLFSLKSLFRFLTDLKVAIGLLSLIALASSIGSFIEQDEPRQFYEQFYPSSTPLYGILDSTFILNIGLDHIYKTWWFLLLLFLLGISLMSCTFTRQFPLFLTSKDFFFKQKKSSFVTLPFFVRLQSFYYGKERILQKIQQLNYSIYQRSTGFYAYKGLLGRLSPILVHFSLLLILGGASFGSIQNFKAQELLPKGELFHIQNPISIGWATSLPSFSTRINEFWVEYNEGKIRQFYSDLSILDNLGKEQKHQTISVNNPLHYQSVDIYQSDWGLLGIRTKDIRTQQILEIPLFPMSEKNKSWITWINTKEEKTTTISTLVFDQLDQTFFIYDEKGNFVTQKNVGDFLSPTCQLIDFLPSTGLLLKYDPSIPILYLGFGFLMITTLISYLPYTQLWLVSQSTYVWFGAVTNRGKIQLEIEFETLLRSSERLPLFFKKEKI